MCAAWGVRSKQGFAPVDFGRKDILKWDALDASGRHTSLDPSLVLFIGE
jgi:hypothetical protein